MYRKLAISLNQGNNSNSSVLDFIVFLSPIEAIRSTVAVAGCRMLHSAWYQLKPDTIANCFRDTLDSSRRTIMTRPAAVA